MRNLVLCALLTAGCARYWVAPAALDKLAALEPERRKWVAVAAERVADHRAVQVRGCYVHPEAVTDGRGRRRVKAYARGSTVGYVALGAGAAVAVFGSGILIDTYYGSHPVGSCSDCGALSPFFGGVATGIGGAAMIFGAVLLISTAAQRPQEMGKERSMQVLDGN